MSMRMMLAGVALFLAQPGWAASFNCAKAATPVEKQICEHPGLSNLDERLSRAYGQAVESSSDKASLRAEQRNWLASVRDRCEDVDCLVVAYVDRLVALVQPKADAKSESLDHLAGATWDVRQPVPGLYDMEFCGDFFNAFTTRSRNMQVIQPLVATDDWSHPEMREHLEGCDKEDFVVAEEHRQIKLGEGLYDSQPNGEVYRSIDRFALWVLPDAPQAGQKEYLLYTGPEYKWKTLYAPEAVGRFMDGGTFTWVVQPGCKETRRAVEHGIPENAPRRPRESVLVRYADALYLITINQRSSTNGGTRRAQVIAVSDSVSQKLTCSAIDQ